MSVGTRTSKVNGVEHWGPYAAAGLGPRVARVLAPPGHGASLLLLLDGQNVFDDGPSFSGGWHAHVSVEQRLPPGRRPVVVGVDHGGAARLDELSPWAFSRSKGQGGAMLALLADTLVPQLRARFGVENHPSRVVIGGSSLGGLFALYAHFRRPDVFGGAMALSPSLWVAGGRIFELIEAEPAPWTSKIYLDYGGHETRGQRPSQVIKLKRALSKKGWGVDRLWCVRERHGRHHERAWRKRLPNALTLFF